MRKLSFFVSVALVASLGLSLFGPVKKAQAAFYANNLMSDAAFDFSNSLNADQINAFLNTQHTSCISPDSGFQAVLPTGYTPTGGFTYGDYTSAGMVIGTAANVYGVNPQVLLATLQKEQGTVVGASGFCDNGDENKYSAAVGYGCPDSGTVYNWSGVSLYRRNGVVHSNTGPTCVNSAAKAGFSQQVIRAAWLLKFGEQRSEGKTNWAVISGSWDNSDDLSTCYGGPMTQGSFKRCPTETNPTAYDGWTTIDGLSTHMDTGPTAALYWYTPHFSGNQHFVSIFEGWFGSTQTPATCTGTETPLPYVQRFYNPRTFEHFYSAFSCDVSFLQKIGYTLEGPVFNTTPSNAAWAVPVYRLYNPQTKQHMWTTTNQTPSQLAAGGSGYQQEAGIVFYVAQSNMPGVHPVVQFYNPKTYLHFWAADPKVSEVVFLQQQAGYNWEGNAFYSQ